MEFRNLTHTKILKACVQKHDRTFDIIHLQKFCEFFYKKTINILIAGSSRFVYLLNLHADFYRNIITSEVMSN